MFWDIVLTQISIIKAATSELHAALYTRLDVVSVVPGGLVLSQSPADTLPALALTHQGTETVTMSHSHMSAWQH